MANEKTYPNYLMHYRTKGSKNGISTTKGYTAVGQKAKGHWVNGHYVYYTEGTPNNWQQQADLASSSARVKQDLHTGKIRARFGVVNPNKGPVEITAFPKIQDPSYKHALEKNEAKRWTEDRIKNSQKNWYSKKPQPSINLKGTLNNWQQQGNNFRAANEAWERFGSGKSRGITGTDQKSNYGGYGTHAALEGAMRGMNAVADLGKLRREKKNLSLYGSGDTKTRNSRSDIANAFADAKADAKNAFKTMKKKAALSIFNKFSTGIRKDKKKKKSLKDLFK